MAQIKIQRNIISHVKTLVNKHINYLCTNYQINMIYEATPSQGN